jgi:tetratricopeptide (TPR) repeat protein
MKKWLIILGLFGAPVMVAGGAYVYRVQTLTKELARAREMMGTRQGHALLQNLAERYPEHAETQFLYGRSLGLFQDSAAAEVRLLKAKALGWPKDEVDRLYWIVRAQRKFRGEAEAVLQAMRDKNDADIGVLQALADGYSHTRHDMAEQLVNKILALEPENGPALALRAYLFMSDPHQAELDRAAADLARAMAGKEDYYYYPEARLLLAVCLRDKGVAPAALKLYRECSADRPNDWRALYGIGMCERYLGNHQEALEAFRKVLTIVPGHVNARLQIAYIHEILGEMPRSLQILRRIEAEYPNEPQVLMQTAKIFAKMGDKERAAEYEKRYSDMMKRYQEKERTKSREQGELTAPYGQP